MKTGEKLQAASPKWHPRRAPEQVPTRRAVLAPAQQQHFTSLGSGPKTSPQKFQWRDFLVSHFWIAIPEATQVLCWLRAGCKGLAAGGFALPPSPSTPTKGFPGWSNVWLRGGWCWPAFWLSKRKGERWLERCHGSFSHPQAMCRVEKKMPQLPTTCTQDL